MVTTTAYSPAAWAWAERALRDYASATNRLIASRSFRVEGDDDERAAALTSALTRMGATIVDAGPCDARFAVGGGASSDAVIELDSAGGRTIDEIRSYRGRPRIDWALEQMPVVRTLARRLGDAGSLRGRIVGIALVLEPKTAALALALADAGAIVRVFGYPEETQPDVADALRDAGFEVFVADAAGGRKALAASVDAFLASGVEFLLDDGSHVIRRAHERVRPSEWTLVGAAEETTSGVRPLRDMDAEGMLRIPVIAANDARSKTLFDNAYGTGQSCVMTILDLLAGTDTAWPMAGHAVVVVGFGPVGEGFARHAAALGAKVVVVERDPIRALRAQFEGYAVDVLEQAAESADLLVSATGVAHTIDPEVLRLLPDGAAVAVAGGVEQEIGLERFEASGAVVESDAGHIQTWRHDHGTVRILDHGNCINVTAGGGNPIEIMDLSFGVQLQCLAELLAATLAPGLSLLRTDLDREVAAIALGTKRDVAPATVAAGAAAATGLAAGLAHSIAAQPSSPRWRTTRFDLVEERE